MDSEDSGLVPTAPKGLAFLTAYRPDIVNAVLDLRPLLGESLSPVTKSLIKIAVQAQRQTYRPLHASITQALAEGATRDEVIDSVLLLLPETGFTAVMDAMNVVADAIEADSPSDSAQTQLQEVKQ